MQRLSNIHNIRPSARRCHITTRLWLQYIRPNFGKIVTFLFLKVVFCDLKSPILAIMIHNISPCFSTNSSFSMALTHIFVKIPTRRQQRDLFDLWVKLPPVTTNLTLIQIEAIPLSTLSMNTSEFMALSSH